MTLTKEWLQQTIAELEEERDATPGAVNEDAAMALAAMKLALASLEAEAVAYIIQDKYERERGTDGHLSRSHASKYVSPEDINEHEIICTALFKAPPLAHSVPDEWTFQNTQRYREDTGRQDAWSAMWGWNACRAAMLQGAERVTTTYKLPDGYVLLPVEPTEEMIAAAMCSNDVLFDKEDDTLFRVQHGEIWRAMLAAAPQQEV